MILSPRTKKESWEYTNVLANLNKKWEQQLELQTHIYKWDKEKVALELLEAKYMQSTSLTPKYMFNFIRANTYSK
jgi:hypothetical protein